MFVKPGRSETRPLYVLKQKIQALQTNLAKTTRSPVFSNPFDIANSSATAIVVSEYYSFFENTKF